MRAEQEPMVATPRSTQPGGIGEDARRTAITRVSIVAGVFCAAFFGTLSQWIHLALSNERNSYLLIVPVISAYLILARRSEFSAAGEPSRGAAGASAFIAIASLLLSFAALTDLTRLSVRVASLVFFLVADAQWFLGGRFLRRVAFPIAFLIFAIPVPKPIADGIEIFLQYSSAEAAFWMLTLFQTPMVRQGLDFMLPGLPIHVAQECSGYNSTFALFMVSTVAGYLFLRSPGRRVALSALVVPLAILRNGFRIMTIALLCVHVDPSMIDSFIHHHGGPIFFALSLIPFGGILWWLRASESARARVVADSK